MQIITMATSNNNYSLKWNEHGVVMEMEFRRLLEVREGVDLKIVCEDGEFWGHRIVVGMGSEFLRGVVGEGEPCTCSHDNPTTIILPEVKSSSLLKILEFIYRGQVNVGEEELVDFFDVAKQLGIKGLIENKQSQESILVKALLGGDKEMDGNTSDEFDEIISEDADYSTSPPVTQPSTSSQLNSRIRATDPRPCPKCGKIYRSAHTLRTHLEDKHTSCPGYRCVLCGTVAKSRNSLHSHMSRQHRGISTKDLPVLPMPSPFDPQLAARLLGESNHGNIPPEESTGSALLDTYLKFIADNAASGGWAGGGDL